MLSAKVVINSLSGQLIGCKEGVELIMGSQLPVRPVVLRFRRTLMETPLNNWAKKILQKNPFQMIFVIRNSDGFHLQKGAIQVKTQVKTQIMNVIFLINNNCPYEFHRVREIFFPPIPLPSTTMNIH